MTTQLINFEAFMHDCVHRAIEIARTEDVDDVGGPFITLKNPYY